ncbi:hypothetical protein HKX48_005349 [Thoreauomyces humboldtii]|nr:hypothetical protein HKX48_005349 [Thoreauomyces humboldtii]
MHLLRLSRTLPKRATAPRLNLGNGTLPLTSNVYHRSVAAPGSLVSTIAPFASRFRGYSDSAEALATQAAHEPFDEPRMIALTASSPTVLERFVAQPDSEDTVPTGAEGGRPRNDVQQGSQADREVGTRHQKRTVSVEPHDALEQKRPASFARGTVGSDLAARDISETAENAQEHAPPLTAPERPASSASTVLLQSTRVLLEQKVAFKGSEAMKSHDHVPVFDSDATPKDNQNNVKTDAKHVEEQVTNFEEPLSLPDAHPTEPEVSEAVEERAIVPEAPETQASDETKTSSKMVGSDAALEKTREARETPVQLTNQQLAEKLRAQAAAPGVHRATIKALKTGADKIEAASEHVTTGAAALRAGVTWMVNQRILDILGRRQKAKLSPKPEQAKAKPAAEKRKVSPKAETDPNSGKRVFAITSLTKIVGLGARRAEELHVEHGINGLDDIAAGKPGSALLTSAQKKGLRFVDDFEALIPMEETLEWEPRLRASLDMLSLEATLGGGHPREEPSGHLAVFVTRPGLKKCTNLPLMKTIRDRLITDKLIFEEISMSASRLVAIGRLDGKESNRARRLVLQLETQTSHWLSLFLSTGSQKFVNRIRRAAKAKGYKITTKGIFSLETNDAVDVADEHALFQRLEMDYLHPAERTA